MIITLQELNECAKALPDPAMAAHAREFIRRVPIVPKMPVMALTEMSVMAGLEIRIATFEAICVQDGERTFWRWTPRDTVTM